MLFTASIKVNMHFDTHIEDFDGTKYHLEITSELQNNEGAAPELISLNIVISKIVGEARYFTDKLLLIFFPATKQYLPINEDEGIGIQLYNQITELLDETYQDQWGFSIIDP